MSLNLMIGAGVIVLGTLLSTSQSGLNYKDQILQLRKEKQAEMELQQLQAKKETKNTKIYGKKRLYYTNKKRKTREAYIRNILESIFRTPFPNVRPDWLINPKTNRRLELDCYSKPLRLCVECDGSQHAYYQPYFHKTYQDYLDMKDRDVMKSIMIKKRGLTLIRVPHTIPDDEMESFLLEQLNKNYKWK